MRLKHLLTGIAASVIAIGSFLEVATADLKFPMLVYRTGAYAPNGIPNADGFVDYYRMINARDGGIGRLFGERELHAHGRPDHPTRRRLGNLTQVQRRDSIFATSGCQTSGTAPPPKAQPRETDTE